MQTAFIAILFPFLAPFFTYHVDTVHHIPLEHKEHQEHYDHRVSRDIHHEFLGNAQVHHAHCNALRCRIELPIHNNETMGVGNSWATIYDKSFNKLFGNGKVSKTDNHYQIYTMVYDKNKADLCEKVIQSISYKGTQWPESIGDVEVVWVNAVNHSAVVPNSALNSEPQIIVAHVDSEWVNKNCLASAHQSPMLSTGGEEQKLAEPNKDSE
ncbi:MAG: hypothetical protein ACON5A_04375 [Candidatus Comchoanobacterales bacterium]